MRLCSPGTVESTLFFLVCVHSYTLRVVGNGIKAQAANPEVKVKGADSVIHQIIDKLKHINQVGLVTLRIETEFAVSSRCGSEQGGVSHHGCYVDSMTYSSLSASKTSYFRRETLSSSSSRYRHENGR